MADVFIGYSAEDEKIAEMLSDALEDMGISVWYAGRDMEPGDFIPLTIAEAIQKCRAFVVILSKFSVCSEYLLSEMQYAVKARYEGAGIILFPLVTNWEGKSALSERIMKGNLWFDATIPPLQERLREFAQSVREQLRTQQESAS